MAYIVIKGSYLFLRDVKTLNFFFFKKQIRKERYIKKGRVLVICGGEGTGKTREIEKLHKKAGVIWKKPSIFIKVGEAISNWWRRAGLENEDLKGLSQFEKNEKLISACKGKVVFLDDIDRAESKVKIELIKEIIRVSDVIVCSCKALNKLNNSIKAELRAKQGLKLYESLKVIDLGSSKEEIKEIGLILGIILVFFVAILFGYYSALLLALGFRWLVVEGRRA
jgi:hypothetical protein